MMMNLSNEKERVFVKLVRKGPHVFEFSEDILMVNNCRIAFATGRVMEEYLRYKNISDTDEKAAVEADIVKLINNEYYNNASIEWYSLREYIDNFNKERLQELIKEI